jgi:hypothetical protein
MRRRNGPERHNLNGRRCAFVNGRGAFGCLRRGGPPRGSTGADNACIGRKVSPRIHGCLSLGRQHVCVPSDVGRVQRFGKPSQLVAFDESGDVRVLYPSTRDGFFTGPGAGISTSVESGVLVERDKAGQLTKLTWRHDGSLLRTASLVNSETHQEVRLSSGDVQLAGTLIRPSTEGKHPTIILVHGSGAESRECAIGSNAEMPSLKRIVPVLFSTVEDWLAKRIPGLDGATRKD